MNTDWNPLVPEPTLASSDRARRVLAVARPLAMALVAVAGFMLFCCAALLVLVAVLLAASPGLHF